jgi:hypothetical protein
MFGDCTRFFRRRSTAIDCRERDPSALQRLHTAYNSSVVTVRTGTSPQLFIQLPIREQTNRTELCRHGLKLRSLLLPWPQQAFCLVPIVNYWGSVYEFLWNARNPLQVFLGVISVWLRIMCPTVSTMRLQILNSALLFDNQEFFVAHGPSATCGDNELMYGYLKCMIGLTTQTIQIALEKNLGCSDDLRRCLRAAVLTRLARRPAHIESWFGWAHVWISADYDPTADLTQATDIVILEDIDESVVIACVRFCVGFCLSPSIPLQ